LPGCLAWIEFPAPVLGVTGGAAIDRLNTCVNPFSLGDLALDLLVAILAEHVLRRLQGCMTTTALGLKSRVGFKACQAFPGYLFSAQPARAKRHPAAAQKRQSQAGNQ
jgi:hypothetical protein